MHPFVPLHTSEWAFDQRFCYFPKDNFILGHPVVYPSNPFYLIVEKTLFGIWKNKGGEGVGGGAGAEGAI